MIAIKSQSELKKIRCAAAIVAKTLRFLNAQICPGISTRELEEYARQRIAEAGGRPAFYGYRGYPAHICTSVNETVVHGIPGKRILKKGDIISLDVGVECDGYYGDAAITLAVGTVSAEAARLIAVTREALYKAIAIARKGVHLSDLSHAIQQCAEEAGFSVVRDFVGHGIGAKLHEEPQIPNFGNPGNGIILQPGMVLAVEPMLNSGTWKVEVLEDGWTAVTRDRKLSAHFEHTICVTDAAAEILTV